MNRRFPGREKKADPIQALLAGLDEIIADDTKANIKEAYQRILAITTETQKIFRNIKTFLSFFSFTKNFLVNFRPNLSNYDSCHPWKHKTILCSIFLKPNCSLRSDNKIDFDIMQCIFKFLYTVKRF
jgi:hypothetical protein